MKKPASLNRNKDFKRVYSRGRYAASSCLVTYALKNRLKFNRVGITTSKKIGNAVKRNRSRRIIRAAYMYLADSLKSGYDIVFVARNETPHVKTSHIINNMNYHLRKLEVLR